MGPRSSDRWQDRCRAAVDGNRRSSIASRYRSHPSMWARWSLTDQPSPGVVNASLPQPASVPSRVAHARLVRSVKSAFIGVAAKASVACSVTLVSLGSLGLVGQLQCALPLLPSVPVIPRGTRNDGHQCCDRQRARQTIRARIIHGGVPRPSAPTRVFGDGGRLGSGAPDRPAARPDPQL